jgi:hypothetical protein
VSALLYDFYSTMAVKWFGRGSLVSPLRGFPYYRNDPQGFRPGLRLFRPSGTRNNMRLTGCAGVEVVDVVFGRVLETTVRFSDPASLVCAGCFPHS